MSTPPAVQFVGEVIDGAAVTDVEDGGDSGGAGRADAAGRVVDACGAAAGEVDDVAGGEPAGQPLAEREPQALVGARDDRDPSAMLLVWHGHVVLHSSCD